MRISPPMRSALLTLKTVPSFSIHRSSVAILFISMLQGCFGAQEIVPKECKEELPLTNYIYTKDQWGRCSEQISSHYLPPCRDHLITKENLLSDWGKPDRIAQNEDGSETWIYEHTIWCGTIVAIPAPLIVPLLLPVCHGFDHITFQGETALRIHFRRYTSRGMTSYEKIKEDPCPEELMQPLRPSEMLKGGQNY